MMQLKKGLTLKSLSVGAIFFVLFSASYATHAFGQASDRLALNKKLSQRLPYWQKRSTIPGLQMSVSFYGDGYIRDYAVGEADVVQHCPLTPYNLMQIGSITKSFISALIRPPAKV